MRLTTDEAQAILKATKSVIQHRPYSVHLYGSRVFDHLNGGDIDIFILTDAWPNEDQNRIHQLLVQIKSQQAIGDRKINLSLITKSEKANDSFWSQIKDFIEIGHETKD